MSRVHPTSVLLRRDWLSLSRDALMSDHIPAHLGGGRHMLGANVWPSVPHTETQSQKFGSRDVAERMGVEPFATSTVPPVGVDVIVLNGGSSSGKSSLATRLQLRLHGTWLVLGIDDLIRAMSYGPDDTGVANSMYFAPDGSVVVHEKFRRTEAAWYEGLAAIARSGTGVIVDEVFLDGGRSQARLRAALDGLRVLWVGVRCDAEVAEERELERGDRTRGMAHDQARRVHEGVTYDVVVDTTWNTSEECSDVIAANVTG